MPVPKIGDIIEAYFFDDGIMRQIKLFDVRRIGPEWFELSGREVSNQKIFVVSLHQDTIRIVGDNYNE